MVLCPLPRCICLFMQTMTAPAIIKCGKLTAILIRTTKSHAFIIPIINSTLRKERISLRELGKYEILEVNVKETIQNHRKHKAGISMEVYNDLNTVLKGLDE
jgi:hypothetical protein